MSVGSDFATVPLSRKLALIGGAAMFIVLFFPWFGVDFGDFANLVGSEGETENGWWGGVGLLAGVSAILLVGWELLRLFGQSPKLNFSADMITAVLAAMTAVFGLIQFFRALSYGGDVEDLEELGIEGPDAGPRWGAFLGLLIVLLLAYAAYLAFQSATRGPAVTAGEPGGSADAAGSVWTAGAGGAAGAGTAAAADDAATPATEPDASTDRVENPTAAAEDTADNTASAAAETLDDASTPPLVLSMPPHPRSVRPRARRPADPATQSAEPAEAADTTSPLDTPDTSDTSDTPPTER